MNSIEELYNNSTVIRTVFLLSVIIIVYLIICFYTQIQLQKSKFENNDLLLKKMKTQIIDFNGKLLAFQEKAETVTRFDNILKTMQNEFGKQKITVNENVTSLSKIDNKLKPLLAESPKVFLVVLETIDNGSHFKQLDKLFILGNHTLIFQTFSKSYDFSPLTDIHNNIMDHPSKPSETPPFERRVVSTTGWNPQDLSPEYFNELSSVNYKTVLDVGIVNICANLPEKISTEDDLDFFVDIMISSNLGYPGWKITSLFAQQAQSLDKPRSYRDNNMIFTLNKEPVILSSRQTIITLGVKQKEKYNGTSILSGEWKMGLLIEKC
nr:MAG: hypothetical protein [Metapenaeopsis lamellata majanivirus]